MNNRLRLVVLSSFLVSGCSFFTSPRDKPIIEDALGNGEMATIAVDSTRRVVVVNIGQQTSCAEPPPDVAESVARSLSAALNAGIEEGGIDAQAAAEFARNYQTAIKQLSPLSQGVKYSRDSLFALCQARSNWFMTNQDFYNLFADVLSRAAILVAQEIPYLNQEFDDAQAEVEAAETSISLLEGTPAPQPTKEINEAGPEQDQGE